MEDIFVVIIMFVILIALLKKPAELRINELYDKITELEKRFDEIKIIQHHEKQELTDKTNEMFKNSQKLRNKYMIIILPNLIKTKYCLTNLESIGH